ncbi:MAG: hypothetical protein VKL20_03095, partial [Synechocystis sp.]|nr:hypothetical protein [Synechocystis sp.]
MNQNDRVIFAELQRSAFDQIVVILGDRFRRVRWGSQGDDWLWILHRGYRLEIDSFYSLQLEVKGP